MASSANSGTLDLDTAPTTSTHALVEQLLALEPSQGSAPSGGAHGLPGSSLDDAAGPKPWGFSGYFVLPALAESGDQALEEPPGKAARATKRGRPRISTNDVSKERARANQAQQRYRERLRQRDCSSQQELEDLVRRLQDMQMDNRQLAARQRAMNDLIKKQEFHLHTLTNYQDVVELEASMLVEEMAAVVTTAQQGSFSAADAKNWTLQAWVSDFFPKYLARLAQLVETARHDPSGPEAAQLEALILMRSNSEAKRALYILFHCVLLAWNLDQAELIPREQWPTPALWHAVLEGLQLSEQQEDDVLEVRERVMLWLKKACALRSDAYDAIGKELVWHAGGDLSQGQGLGMLRSALELERRAAGHYFYVVVFDVLTPWQQAWLDAGPQLAPWSADLWALGEALASKRGLEPAPNFSELLQVPPSVQAYMPRLSGFQLLTAPCLAQGAGLQLKRGLLCCWYLTTGRPLLQENKRSPVVLPNAQALKDWTIWELMHNPLPA